MLDRTGGILLGHGLGTLGALGAMALAPWARDTVVCSSALHHAANATLCCFPAIRPAAPSEVLTLTSCVYVVGLVLLVESAMWMHRQHGLALWSAPGIVFAGLVSVLCAVELPYLSIGAVVTAAVRAATPTAIFLAYWVPVVTLRPGVTRRVQDNKW